MPMEIVGEKPKVGKEIKLFVSIWGAARHNIRTKDGRKSLTFTVKGAQGIDQLAEILKDAIRSAA